jgi:hypothetical protein
MQVNGYNPRFGYCHTEFQLFLSLALEAMKSQYRRCVAIEDCDWNDMEVYCCTGHGSCVAIFIIRENHHAARWPSEWPVPLAKPSS